MKFLTLSQIAALICCAACLAAEPLEASAPPSATAHSLVSLCAPRPVFINGGTTDNWTDAYGMYLSAAGATPVYQLLGKQGVVMPDGKTKIDTAYISGDLGYRNHEGGHTDAPDWPAFMQFAAKCFNSRTPMDVTAETEISQQEKASGRTISKTVRITNLSVYRLRAPLTFVAKNLKSGVALFGSAGKTPEGDPFVAIPGTLNPGESVTLSIKFTFPSARTAPTYVPAVYSGNWWGKQQPRRAFNRGSSQICAEPSQLAESPPDHISNSALGGFGL